MLQSFGATCVGRPSIFIINDREFVLENIAVDGLFYSFAGIRRYFLQRAIVEIIISSIDMLGASDRPHTNMLVFCNPTIQQLPISLPIILDIVNLALAAIGQSLP